MLGYCDILNSSYTVGMSVSMLFLAEKEQKKRGHEQIMSPAPRVYQL